MAVGGLGGIGVIVFLLLPVLGGGGGGDGNIFGQLPTPAGPASEDPNIQQGTGGEADDELEDFMRAIMNDLQATWTDIFDRQGERYEPTSLVLFTDNVSTACGPATSATGPFYCPGDSLEYIDLDFFRELSDRFGAAGDFAQAYVIAHEFGHHVQNILGTLPQVSRLQGERPSDANELSVRLELQADCYAGIWGRSAYDDQLLEEGDLEEGLAAAAAVGDDRLQTRATGTYDRETFTHGSSEQRRRWFLVGFQDGRVDACNTFEPSEV